MKSHLINVEVAYAAPDRQLIVAMEVEQGSTIEVVIMLSGILVEFPEINLARQSAGIFSKPCELSDAVKQGDRIEIYRPLTIDPKEARRAKAKKARAI